MSTFIHFFQDANEKCSGFRISESQVKPEPYLIGVDLKGIARQIDSDQLLDLAKSLKNGVDNIDKPKADLLLPGHTRRRGSRIIHRN